MKKLGKLEVTERGFGIIRFKDIYGDECSLQESSLADKPAVWLGCDRQKIHHVTNEPIGPRMHLDKDLARKLVLRLNRWIKRGSL